MTAPDRAPTIAELPPTLRGIVGALVDARRALADETARLETMTEAERQARSARLASVRAAREAIRGR